MNRRFSIGMALFLAAYYLLVGASNLCNILVSCGWLPASWGWASDNLAAIQQATGLTDPQAATPLLLLSGACALQLAIAALAVRGIWRAASLDTALMAGCCMCAAFLLADEVCTFYLYCGLHLQMAGAHLLAVVTLRSLQRAPLRQPAAVV